MDVKLVPFFIGNYAVGASPNPLDLWRSFFGSTRLGRTMATTLVVLVWDGGGDSGGDGWRSGMETGTAAVTHTGTSCAGRAISPGYGPVARPVHFLLDHPAGGPALRAGASGGLQTTNVPSYPYDPPIWFILRFEKLRTSFECF